MTLVSKLLEGYCPEGYDVVEEGLTPDIVMERTNSICVECINQLYAVAEAYFTDDLIGQTQVLTEGSGVVDKIKELISKFVEKIKKIWEWFTGKVKKFPAWLKSLFTKVEENNDKLIKRLDIGHNNTKVTAVNLSAVEKYLDAVGSVQDKVKSYSDELTRVYTKVDLYDLLSKAEKIMADASKTTMMYQDAKIDDVMDEVAKQYKNDNREDRNEQLDKYVNELKDANGRLAKAEETESLLDKVRKCAIKAKSAAQASKNTIIKPVENSISVIEKMLTKIKSDGFKSRLEKAFASDNGAAAGSQNIGANFARVYINSSVKILTEVTADLNKLMSVAQSVVSGYQAIASKLYSSVKLQAKKEND